MPKVVVSLQPDISTEQLERSGVNVVSQISWNALTPYFNQIFNVRNNEEIIGVVVDERGIQIRLRNK